MLRVHEREELSKQQSWESANRGDVFGETTVVDLDLAAINLDDSQNMAAGGMIEKLAETLPLLHEMPPPTPPRAGVGCCRRKKVSGAVTEKQQHLLGQWTSTAISGNDITSSVLYMGGLCTAAAGPFAPISILLVVGLLYLFRSVYSEVVTALPLNGGAYNALLNTTTKLLAAIGGTLTVLSYVATAVVSADSAVNYFHSLLPDVPYFWLPVAVLGFFALLNLVGITESSVVALGIFVAHLTTLSILTVACIVYVFVHGWPMIAFNWSWEIISDFGNPAQAIAFGFGAALLGVSGFESSANFVEEQEPGVFTKTLRNMWIAVGIFNPLLTLLATGMLDVRRVRDHTMLNCQQLGMNITNATSLPCDELLSQMAGLAGGPWLHTLVGVDATLVLCGSVLTAYVGVGGLIRRMALDRCLPSFFLMQNPITKTNHFIILTFFATTSSLYLIVEGDINTLAGVYAIAFLCVMALFALANMLLKYKRSHLQREVRSSWPGVMLAFAGVVVGLFLNIFRDVSIVKYFLIYFAVFLALSVVMFVRVKILRIAFNLMKKTCCCRGPCGIRVKGWVRALKKQPVVFFTNNGLLSVLNKAVIYIRDNEFTDRVVIVHMYQGNLHEEPARSHAHRLRTNVRILDRMYPKSRINLVFAQGEFGPDSVERISELLQIPRNFFFLSSPTGISSMRFNIQELGGVRLITH